MPFHIINIIPLLQIFFVLQTRLAIYKLDSSESEFWLSGPSSAYFLLTYIIILLRWDACKQQPVTCPLAILQLLLYANTNNCKTTTSSTQSENKRCKNTNLIPSDWVVECHTATAKRCNMLNIG